jgi:hypothetical protein
MMISKAQVPQRQLRIPVRKHAASTAAAALN